VNCTRRPGWTPFAGIALLACCGLARADELRRAAPPEVPPLQPAAPAVQPPTLPVPAGGEKVLLPALRGIVLVPDAGAASLAKLGTGVDVSGVPLAQSAAITNFLRQAIGRPASLESLRRLPGGIGRLLREQGLPFVSAWVPPQDLTQRVVRIVVRPARTEGPVTVVGAQYFTAESYLTWIRQEPGALPDATVLQEDIDWINRNPFRNAVLAAEPGSTPDSTRLSLRVHERRPWRVFAGTDNTGTRDTDEQRVFAGFNWGNAFGRGDQLSYQYRADPSRTRSTTHSGSYQTDLPWRHTLGLSFAWSKTKPDLGPVFDQSGKSWQVGAQYRVPLPTQAARDAVVKQEVNVGLDFKYADNNLEFAAIPVTNNKTHVAQLTLGYLLSREDADSSGYLAPQLVLSPGHLTKYNVDTAFDGSRANAPARYAYVRVDGERSQSLPAGWRWDARANLQYSSVPLLGSEQITGSGAQAVRGYRESTAFGDSGLVLRNELHAPALKLGAAGDSSLDAFGFYDAAWLRTAGPGADSTQLRSVGVGAMLRIGTWATLDVTHGVVQKQLASDDTHHYTHLRLQVAY
jgi:hemolysin activation/secretion protein